jgi:hypothetical protein
VPMTTYCILTPRPDYDEKWQGDAALLTTLFGDDLTYRAWTDPGELSHFDMILPLLAWGYQRDPVRWFQALDAWEAAGLPFANPIATLRWNTDKDYLLDLEAAGVAIVPTVETHCLCQDDLTAARARFAADTLVIKPPISGGADGTYLLKRSDPIPFAVLEREMLIQPLMPAIAEEGEYSLFYFGGQYGHAILKKPADGDFRVQEQFGGGEVSVFAPKDALQLAVAALAAAPALPLYARVDMVRGPDGAFKLMELELIEPSLFLQHSADSGQMLADAVAALTR